MPFAEGETVFLSSKAVHYTSILKSYSEAPPEPVLNDVHINAKMCTSLRTGTGGTSE